MPSSHYADGGKEELENSET